MKIGVLTLPFNNNYGGVLQAYALQKYLRERGHNVKLILRVDTPATKYKKKLIKEIKYKIKFLFGKTVENIEIRKGKYFRNFISKYFKVTKTIYYDKDFNKLNRYKFDTFIVGSDQVWRTEFTHDRYKNYFFDFLEQNPITSKRIAYAASFGTDNWTLGDEETKYIKYLVEKFDGISIREQSGIKICNDIFNVKAAKLLDPTFLLNIQDYTKFFKRSKTYKNELLVYFLDPTEDKNCLVTKIQEQLQLNPFKVGYDDNLKIYPKIETWLQGFYDAKFVVTDSFHGCVFSILFNKPFVVYGNKFRGMSRFESLLSDFGLIERIILDSNDLGNLTDKEIDFNRINKIIQQFKNETDTFFKKMGV